MCALPQHKPFVVKDAFSPSKSDKIRKEKKTFLSQFAGTHHAIMQKRWKHPLVNGTDEEISHARGVEQKTIPPPHIGDN